MNSAHSPWGLAHISRGQTMVEYVLIVSAIAVAACAAFGTFGTAVASLVRSFVF